MKKLSIKDAVNKINNGSTIMVGGFLASGSPIKLLDAVAEKVVKDLTLICNATAFADIAHGQLITNKQVQKTIASHIGTNPTTN